MLFVCVSNLAWFGSHDKESKAFVAVNGCRAVVNPLARLASTRDIALVAESSVVPRTTLAVKGQMRRGRLIHNLLFDPAHLCRTCQRQSRSAQHALRSW